MASTGVFASWISCLFTFAYIILFSENESTESPIQDGATSLIPPSQNGFESHYANATQTSVTTPPVNETGPSPPSLGAIPLATGPSPNSNLIILNTPPSPTNSKNILNSNHTDLTHNQLSIPNPIHGLAIGSKKSNSDPVSPNVPWHPELDRRHSDSFSKDLLNRSHDEVQTSPTYQNTNLTSGNEKWILFYFFQLTVIIAIYLPNLKCVSTK